MERVAVGNDKAHPVDRLVRKMVGGGLKARGIGANSREGTLVEKRC